MSGRDLSLASRRVATRDQKSDITIFDIEDIEKHFDENLSFIKAQLIIADELVHQGKEEQAKEIWRSQVVLLDSAFDFYMHELIKLGILNLFHGDWSDKTAKYNNLMFSMSILEAALADTENDDWLKKWVTDQYATQTLMSYDCFKASCNLLGIDYKSVANVAFYERGCKEKTEYHLKSVINQLFYRRNAIAHQMDRNRENAKRQDIDKSYVESAMNDIYKIVVAVGKEARKRKTQDVS